MLSTQAQQVKQANVLADHKSYDLTICEALVIVSEACAAFSAFTNVWAKSSVLVIKNITLDKGIPNAASISGAPAASAPMMNEISKVAATSVLDADQLFSVLGPAGFTGDLVQMCSNYFLKKYCVVLSRDLQHNYKCTFRNKNMVTYWDYSFKTEATISLRYPKSGSKGSIIKMPASRTRPWASGPWPAPLSRRLILIFPSMRITIPRPRNYMSFATRRSSTSATR